ncbi:MAG: hypothetical protein WBH09_06890 [Rugosibacter sp.]
MTLVLDEPPQVKIRWEENAEPGTQEGAIINIGAGFTISKDKLHQDLYFPSFDAPRPNLDEYDIPQGLPGPLLMDTSVALGTLPRAAEHWKTVQRAMRFHRTGQQANLDAQLDSFWGAPRTAEETLENALFNFLLRFLSPNGTTWLGPLGKSLQQAQALNAAEYAKLVSHYDNDLKAERFEAYSDILSEYFKAYGEFSQTLVYARRQLPLPPNAVATSSDFERTRMFYGNAFEVLGSHLDVPAAVNNILAGRAYDQMNAMDLKQFRTINKAGRTNCFAANVELTWLVTEYDSTVRNASHHRWFKLDDSRTQISYRSGGTGTSQRMSYAEYLTRCNRLAIQIMVLACVELILLSSSGNGL